MMRPKRHVSLRLRILWLLCLAFSVPLEAQEVNREQDVIDPQNAALHAFKQEQIALLEAERDEPFADADEIERWLEQWRARARTIREFVGDAAPEIARANNYPLEERAYFASNDASPQPFWVGLPDGYTPEKKWPLIVFLHGYSPSITKAAPWFPPLELIEEAKNSGFLFVIPYGRRNSDFVGIGQDDTTRVRREVERLYSVDTTRRFLLGISMGGTGAYTIGLHQAGDWTALSAICARSDLFRWFKTTPEALPPWKRVLLEADNPLTLFPNARATPMLVQHGELDLVVPVEHARLAATEARKLEIPLRYDEYPGADHWFQFQIEAAMKSLQWFHRVEPAELPTRFSLVTGDLKESRAHWARVEAFERYGELARLEVELEGRSLRVQAANVARFSLLVPSTLSPDDGDITVSVNGEQAQPWNAADRFVWTGPDAKLEKSPTRTGPFKNLMRDPFLLAWGNEADFQAARQFAEEWEAFADGKPRIKAARDVTGLDKARFNLILFGTRESNPLLSEIAALLPVELDKDGARVNDKKIAGSELGLRMVWKSPWHESRLIGVCSGARWGKGLPANHKWDLIPDYIIYDGTLENDGTQRALEAGWFDGNWNLLPPLERRP